MLNSKQKELLLGYHFYASFFESLDKVADFISIDDEFITTYHDLFYGMDANIKIPLWASTCKTDDGVLLNEVTFSVIEFYYKWGYRPNVIDGNPVDYIANQFRFLEYLEANDCKKASHEFKQLYLIDTVDAIVSSVRDNSQHTKILEIMDEMLLFVAKCEVPDYLSRGEYEYTQGKLKPAIIPEEMKIVKTAGFNNCGGRCVIHAHVREGCILNITTDNSDNDPQIRSCVKGRGYRHTFFSTDRLRYPMKRVGERGEGKFKRITWEEAIDTIVNEWIRIKESYGVGSRFVMYGWGVAASLRGDYMMKRLLNVDGGFLEGYNTYSDACTVYISPYIYGDILCSNSVEDVLNTNLLILWGHNPAETIYGSERNYYFTKAREKGIKVIVIDPRRSDSAIAYADQWIGIKPSTDSALADAMAYVIWSSGLHNKAFMDKYCIGFDKDHMPESAKDEESYEEYLFGTRDGIAKTPQWAAQITGIPADVIKKLAIDYATAKPACILPGLGLQRTGNGEQTTRSLAMLACLTGNVGIKGGGSGASIWTRAGAAQPFPTLESDYPGTIPHFLWSKAVREGTNFTTNDGLKGVDKLDSNIKMIFNLAGNTLVNQHSNINETKAILKDTNKCEFIVCSDIFMTPSARFADIILPAVSGFENDNMTGPWQTGDYVLYTNKTREPFFECKFEFEWISKVAEKLGYGAEFHQKKKTTAQWLEYLYEQMQQTNPNLPDYQTFKKAGGIKWKEEELFIAYENQIKDLENNPFSTPSGKIEIYSQALKDMNNPIEIPAIPKYVPCVEGPEDELINKYPLQLIGWHTKRRTHSIHDNNSFLEEVNPQTLWINPIDANVRNIKDGDTVKVFNDRGIVKIKVVVTSRIIAGVVAMPQGAWYTPDADGVDIRGSINVLTSTHKPTPVAKGNPQHTNLVEIVKV